MSPRALLFFTTLSLVASGCSTLFPNIFVTAEGTQEQWDTNVNKGLTFVEGTHNCSGSPHSLIFEEPNGKAEELSNGAWHGWWPVGTKIIVRDTGHQLATVGPGKKYPNAQKLTTPCE